MISTARSRSRSLVLGLCLAAALIPGVVRVASAEQDAPSFTQDTGSRVETINLPATASPTQVSIALSQATPLTLPLDEVLIARDNDFADALASGGLQDARPLLLVPDSGPLPSAVAEEITRLGAQRVVILGGTAAVSERTASDIASLEVRNQRVTVDRIAGAERIATAVEVARRMPPIGTAIVARAYAAPDNPTSGFADALSAGALAAETGWPILLTDTDELSTATLDFLAGGGIEQILVVGGTAAVGAGVEEELSRIAPVRRVASADRFGTAVEIAKENDDATDGELIALTLIEGTDAQAWVAGFAAASGSAFRDAPILLAADEVLPPSTAAFMGERLGPEKVAETTNVVLTCLINLDRCEEGRRESGLPAAPQITTDPPNLAYRDPGETVTVTVDPSEESRGQMLEFQGCLSGGDNTPTNRVVLDDRGQATLTVPGLEAYTNGHQCLNDIGITFANGESQAVLRDWGVRPETDLADFSVNVSTYFESIPRVRVPVPLTVDLTCSDVLDDATVADSSDHWLSVSTRSGYGRMLTADGMDYVRARTPRSGTCDVQFGSPIAGVSVVEIQLRGPANFGDVIRTEPGAAITLDVQYLSENFFVSYVTAVVRLADGTTLPGPWPGPVETNQPVWVENEYVAVRCDGGIDEIGNTWFSLPSGTQCTVTPTIPGGEVAILRSNLLFEPTSEPLSFTADPELGPIGLYGTDDPATFPVR